MSFRVLGTGMYVPPRVVTNDDLSQFLETNDEWITQRVGVKERHISTNETAADMGAKAARAALENSGVAAEEIDLILAASVSGESISPSVSCMIQNLLGLSCMTMDINAACSAFDFLLETAAGFFARGKVKKVLVIGAERLSRLLDWNDRGTAVIFGDGAGAVVLEAGENYLDAVFDVKGGDDVIDIPQPVGMSPFYERGQEKKPYIHMAGQETFKFAVTAICRDCKEILERNGLTFDDIAYIVPHQANQRIIDFASTKLKVPKEKFYLNIHKYGNTSSASIPIALDELNRAGKLHRGDLLLLPAFGGGLASACCLVRWSKRKENKKKGKRKGEKIMVFEKIAAMLAEKLECDAAEIKMDTEFGTLGIDSLDVMELLMNLEEELGTEIEMGENKVNTVGDLVKLIEEKQA